MQPDFIIGLDFEPGFSNQSRSFKTWSIFQINTKSKRPQRWD